MTQSPGGTPPKTPTEEEIVEDFADLLALRSEMPNGAWRMKVNKWLTTTLQRTKEERDKEILAALLKYEGFDATQRAVIRTLITNQ